MALFERRRARRPEDADGVTLPWGPSVEVVGESFYQDAFLAICGPKSDSGQDLAVVAELRPEPHNEYDPAAVAVYVGDHKVGHLSRADARSFRSVIDETISARGFATCQARIRGGWDRGGGDSGHFGITLCFSARR